MKKVSTHTALATILVKPLVMLLAFVFVGILGYGQITYTWKTAAVDNNWTNPSNWNASSGNSYPGTATSDIVVIVNGTNYQPTISGSLPNSIAQLTVKNTSTGQGNLTINNGGSLTVSGASTPLTFTGGIITNNGSMTVTNTTNTSGSYPYAIYFNNPSYTAGSSNHSNTDGNGYFGSGSLTVNMTGTSNSQCYAIYFGNNAWTSSLTAPTMTFNSSTTLNVASSQFAIYVAAGNTGTTNGIIDGTLNVGSSVSGVTYSLIYLNGNGCNLTIKSSATITCYENLSSLYAIQITSSGTSLNSTLTNNGIVSIYGTCKSALYLYSTSTATGTCKFDNEGTFTGNISNASTYTGTLHMYAAGSGGFNITNNGTLNLTNTASGTGKGYAFYIGSGPSLSISNGSAGVINYTGAPSSGGNNADFTGSGSLTTTLTNAGNITSNCDMGNMTISNSGSISFSNATYFTGTALGSTAVTTNTGTIITNTGSSWLYKIPGVTTSTGSVIAPGGTGGYGLADFATAGNISVTDTLKLDVGLAGGTTAGTNFDQLLNSSATAGVMTISGLTVKLNLISNPASTTTITIISAGSGTISGTLASVTGLNGNWTISYTSTAVKLTYTAPVTYTWTGASDNNWANAGNWSLSNGGSGYPGNNSTDIVVINTGTPTISSGTYTIAQLTVGNTSSSQGNLTINSGATLNVSGTSSPVTISGGIINNAGTMSVSATGSANAISFNTPTSTSATYTAGTGYFGAGSLSITVSSASYNAVYFNNTSWASPTVIPTMTFKNTTLSLQAASWVIGVASGTSNGIIDGTLTIGSSVSGVTFGLISQAGGGSNLSIKSGASFTCYENSSSLYAVQLAPATGNATFTNNGTVSISGTCKAALYLTNASTGTCTFDNEGSFTGNISNASAYVGTMYLYASVTSAVFNVTNNGTLNLTNTASGTNLGYAFFAAGNNNPTVSITNGTTGILNYTGTPSTGYYAPFYGGSKTYVSLSNAGQINTNCDIVGMAITNSGTISFVGDANSINTLAIGSSCSLTNTGTINTNAGISPSILNQMGGLTLGSTSTGTLSPGGSGYGILDLQNASSSSLYGTLTMQVGGNTTAGTDYDQLKNTSLTSGTLDISNLALNISSIYTPTSTTTISIISLPSGGSIAGGAFSSVTGLTTGWKLVYNSTSVQLVATYPTISFSNISKSYGSSPFTLNATSNSLGAITYASNNPSVATISGSTVTIVGLGTAVITASQSANGSYLAGTKTATLTVVQGTPTVTVTPGTYTYNGTSQGPGATETSNTGDGTSYTFSYASTDGTTYPASSTPPTNAGSYKVTATVAATTNYTSANSTATSFTINKVTPTITTAPTATGITYGQTLASSTLSGGVASVAGTFAFTTPTSIPSSGNPSVGYTFTPTDATNYNTKTGTVSVAVAKAVLTLTVGNQTVNYGTAVATVTGLGSYTVTSGLQNGDASTVVTGTANYYTTYTTTTPASGSPTINISGGLSATNYTLSYVPGNITVTAVGPFTYTWTGASDNNWANASNWTVSGGGSGYPGNSSTDVAIINTGSPTIASGTYTLTQLQVGNSSTGQGNLTISNGVSLTVLGTSTPVTLAGGIITNNGLMTVTNATNTSGSYPIGISFLNANYISGNTNHSNTDGNGYFGTGSLTINVTGTSNSSCYAVYFGNTTWTNSLAAPTMTFNSSTALNLASGGNAIYVATGTSNGILDGALTIGAPGAGNGVTYSLINQNGGGSNLTVKTGATITCYENLASLYAIQITSSGTSLNTTLTNNGTINVYGTCKSAIYLYSAAGATGICKFDNEGNFTGNISNASTYVGTLHIYANGIGAFFNVYNNGTLSLTNTNNSGAGYGYAFYASSNNTPSISVSNTSSGVINYTGAPSSGGNADFQGSGVTTLTNAGIINANCDIPGMTITNSGTITFSNASYYTSTAIASTSSTTNTGIINTNSGNAYLYKIPGVTTGSGSVIAPGGTGGYGLADFAAAGSMSVTGALNVDVDLASGTTAGTNFDQLKNSGLTSGQTMTITNLTVNLNLVSNPSSTTTITIISAGSGTIVGTLASVNGLSSNWAISYTSTAVQLTYTAVPLTYTWTGATSSDYTVAHNWNPDRTSPNTLDILQFTSSPSGTITNVPTQTIGQLVLSGANTTVTLQSAAGGSTLNVGSINNTGDEISVPSGCSLSLASLTNDAFTIALANTAGVTSNIIGTLNINANANGGFTNVYNAQYGVTTVLGTVNNAGTISNATTTSLVFNSNSNYNHNRTDANGTFPAASYTSVNVGMSGCTTAAANINVTNFPASVGTFTINEPSAFTTGSVTISSLSPSGNTLTVNNLTVQSGVLNFGSAINTVNVGSGGINLPSGGALTPRINFSASGSQTITCSGDLNMAAATAYVTLVNFVANGTTYNGSLTVNNFMQSGASSLFYLNAQQAGGSCTGTLTVTGNFNKTAGGFTQTDNNASGTLVLKGSAAQTFSSNNFSTGPSIIEINNQASSTVTLGTSLTVNGSLKLTKGILVSSATYPVTLAGGFSGGSASSYISGQANYAASSSTPFTLPIGYNSVYAPITITPAATAATFKVQYGSSAIGTANSPLLSYANSAVYSISATSATTGTVSFPYSFASGVVNSTADLVLATAASTTFSRLSASPTVTGSVSSGTISDATNINFSTSSINVTVGSTNSASLLYNYTSFTWTGAISTDFQNSSNWSPSRTSTSTSDILNFTGNANVTNVPTQSIAQLILSGTAAVSLQSTSGGATLTVGSYNYGGDEISVPTGCSLSLTSLTTDAFTLALANTPGVTSGIAGTLNVNSNANGTFTNIYNAQYGVTTVTGIVNNAGTFSNANNSTLIFNSGSTYNHTRSDNGTFPAASYTSVNVGLSNTVNSTGQVVVTNFPSSVNIFTMNATGLTSTGNLSINSLSNGGSAITFGTINISSGTLGFGSAITGITVGTGGITMTGGNLGFPSTIATLSIGSGGINISAGRLNFISTTSTGNTYNYTCNGDLTISGTGYITLFNFTNSTSTCNLTVNNFTQTANTTLFYLNSSSNAGAVGTLKVLGNFSKSGGGTFTQTTGTTGNLVMNGSTAQTFSCDAFGASFPTTIEIKNTGTSPNNIVSLGSNFTLNSTLKFTSGLLALSAYNLNVNSATINNTTTSYIYTNGTGKLVWYSVPSIGNTIFPIGTATSYAPLTFTGGTSGKNITVGVSSTLLGTVYSPSNVVNLQWSILASGNTTPSVTFQYNSVDQGSTYSASGTVLGIYSNNYYTESSALGAVSGSNPYTATMAFTSNLPTSTASYYGIGNLYAFNPAPSAPTLNTVVAGDRTATVTFTAPTYTGEGAITNYTVTAVSGASTFTATGASSPISMPQLAESKTYTFTITASNSYATGPASNSRTATTPSATTFYVSNSGSDANVGSIGYPLLTIAQAMSSVTTGDTVYLRAGTYRETVNITTPNITISGYQTEQAIISGTDATNLSWTTTTVNGKSVYVAPYSGSYFEQLFFNGKPMVQARWPNLSLDTTGTNWNFWDANRWASTGNGSALGTVVDASSNSLASSGLNAVGAWAVLNVSHQYYTWTRPVLTQSGNTFTYPTTGSYDFGGSVASDRPYNDNRYYLFGKIDFLDAPGEWFYDTLAHNLYFYPPTGAGIPSLPSAGIEIKSRNFGITATNQDKLNIQNITIFGTAFQFNSLTGGCDTMTFENNTVLYSSWTEFYNVNSGSFGAGNESNYPVIFGNKATVSGNTFAYGALSSLMVSGHNTLVENNSFHDFNFNSSLTTPLLQISRNWSSYVGYASDATVRYNDMFSSGGVVLIIGQDSNNIYYNHIYNGFLSCYGGNIDVAMLYTSPAAGSGNCTTTEGTHIYKNWIHNGYAGSVHQYWGGGIGIRGDDSTSGLIVDHNLTWNLGGAGIEIKNPANPTTTQANFAYNNSSYSNSWYDVQTPTYYYSILLDATSLANENQYSLIKNNAGKGISGSWGSGTYPYSSNVTNNYTSNALLPLMDSTHYDFRPATGSALVDAGTVIAGITGYVSGSAPDEGAYELGDTSYFIPGYRSSTTSFPILPNGTTGVSVTRDQLMWRPAYNAVYNKIYLGTISTDLALQATTAEEHNVFTLPTLSGGTTYYWRVDAVMSNGSVVTGTVWSFTTSSTCTANSYVGVNGGSANVASNWCGGVLPTSSTNVIISNNSPQLTANLSVGGINLNSGINLNGFGLTVNGSVTGTGLITGSPSSNLTFAGAASGTIYFNQTITDSTNALDSLTISTSNTITLGNSLRLIGVLLPNSGTLNTGVANLQLISNASGTARIDQVIGSITGTVSVWRYIPAKTARKFSYIGSPVSTLINSSWQKFIYITGSGSGGSPCGTTTGYGGTTDKYNSNGFDVTQTNTPSMFTYNATKVNGSRYVSIPNTTGTYLTPGVGYSINIRGNRSSSDVTCANQLETSSPTAPESVTLSVSGTITTGAKSVTLYDTALSKYTLIANPYPSQISYTAFQAANSSKIYNKMWTYSPFGGGGNFTTFSNGVIANGATGYDNTHGDYIASGQAFFVEATQAGSASNVTFQESHKTSGVIPNTEYFGAMPLNKLIRVGLKTTSNDLLDEIVARFNNEGSPVYNSVWDAASFSNAAQVLNVVKGNEKLAIATYSDITASDTIQLGVNSTSTGTFRLSFSDFDGLDSSSEIQLIDKFLGTSQNVRLNPVYDFNVTSDTASIGANRFFITVSNPASLPIKLTNFYATALTTVNKLSWQTGSEVNSKGFEVQRKEETGDWATIGFLAAKGTASTYNFEDSTPSTLSYYRLIQTDENGEQSFSKVVTVQRNEPFAIKVWPNPTSDWIHLSLPTNNSSLQTSVIKIFSPSGNELLTKSTTDANINIDLTGFAKQVYILEIDMNGKTYRNKIVLQ